MAPFKKAAPTTLPTPKATALVVEEVKVAADVCSWCHTSTNRLHRRSGCKE